MKKIILTILILILPVLCYGIDNRKTIERRDIFSVSGTTTITASGNVSSDPIDLGKMKPEGYFTLILTTAGASSDVKAEYLLCDTETGTYYEPSEASDIVASHSPGTAHYSFSPALGMFMKIKITETAGNDVTAFTAIIIIQ